MAGSFKEIYSPPTFKLAPLYLVPLKIISFIVLSFTIFRTKTITNTTFLMQTDYYHLNLSLNY